MLHRCRQQAVLQGIGATLRAQDLNFEHVFEVESVGCGLGGGRKTPSLRVRSASSPVSVPEERSERVSHRTGIELQRNTYHS